MAEYLTPQEALEIDLPKNPLARRRRVAEHISKMNADGITVSTGLPTLFRGKNSLIRAAKARETADQAISMGLAIEGFITYGHTRDAYVTIDRREEREE